MGENGLFWCKIPRVHSLFRWHLYFLPQAWVQAVGISGGFSSNPGEREFWTPWPEVQLFYDNIIIALTVGAGSGVFPRFRSRCAHVFRCSVA